MNNTNNIKEIKVIGFDSGKDQFKFEVTIDENSFKLYLKWANITKSFDKIKKELNRDIHLKLLYDIQSRMIIKDRKYMSAKDFIYGIPLKKNKRKINDVQNLFKYLLEQKDNEQNRAAVELFLENCFKILN